MNGYQRDRLAEIRFRLSMLALVCAVGGGVWIAGPGLERVLDDAREHKAEHWAPKRLWHVAQFMELTWREKRAQAVYEEFYLLYGGDESLIDLSSVSDDEDQWSYLPWVTSRYDPETRPRPARVGDTPHPLLGEVLIAHATYWERRKAYQYSRHIFTCVSITAAPGSPAHRGAIEGLRRDMLRSY